MRLLLNRVTFNSPVGGRGASGGGGCFQVSLWRGEALAFFWVGNFWWTRWDEPILVGTFEVSYATQDELLGRWTFVCVKFKPSRSCVGWSSNLASFVPLRH